MSPNSPPCNPSFPSFSAPWHSPALFCSQPHTPPLLLSSYTLDYMVKQEHGGGRPFARIFACNPTLPLRDIVLQVSFAPFLFEQQKLRRCAAVLLRRAASPSAIPPAARLGQQDGQDVHSVVGVPACFHPEPARSALYRQCCVAGYSCSLRSR
jgi:hypothetical protein